MGIELSKPFGEYVAVKELGPVGDGRRFVAVFLFRSEGTNQTSRKSVEWRYSGTQAALDEKAGVDGVSARKNLEIERLRRTVENELNETGARVYDDPGQKIAVWGPKKWQL